MKDFMTSQLVTRDQFEAYHAEHANHIANTVEHAVAPVKDDVNMLRERVIVLENATRSPVDDPGFRRISFLGLPENADPDKRIEEVTKFIEKFAPRAPKPVVENIHKGSHKNNPKRELTTVTFAEFASTDTRNRVLEVLSKHKFEFEGKGIDFKKGLSKSASERNGAIKDAFSIITKDPRAIGKKVEKIHMGDRGVTVDNVYMFTQGNVGKGSFQGEFSDLQLPTRPQRRQ